MGLKEIEAHWNDWAGTYGKHLRATTKTWTIKALELDALARSITQAIPNSESENFSVLEIGCGNGMNCLELASTFKNAELDGIDYVAEMISSAKKLCEERECQDRVRFFEGNALKINDTEGLQDQYNIVFSDRCIINLNTIELQKEAISQMVDKVSNGGHLIMIENSTKTHGTQNDYRQLLGIEKRPVASFNMFFDEEQILPHVKECGLELINTEDFGSLHDLLLYVLVPAINGGEVDYEHPIIEAATSLSKSVAATTPNAFGEVGQNRLYVFRKPL